MNFRDNSGYNNFKLPQNFKVMKDLLPRTCLNNYTFNIPAK